MNSAALLYLSNFAKLTINGLQHLGKYKQGFQYYFEPAEIMKQRENHRPPAPQAVFPALHRAIVLRSNFTKYSVCQADVKKVVFKRFVLRQYLR